MDAMRKEVMNAINKLINKRTGTSGSSSNNSGDKSGSNGSGSIEIEVNDSNFNEKV